MQITGVEIVLSCQPGANRARLILHSLEDKVIIQGGVDQWPSPEEVQSDGWYLTDDTEVVYFSYEDGCLCHLMLLLYKGVEHSHTVRYRGPHLDWLLSTLGLLHRHCQGEEVEIPLPEGLPVTVERVPDLE